MKNCLHEDLKEILSEETIKEGQTDSRKTSEDCRMIAIVDDEDLQKRKTSWRILQNTRTNMSWTIRVWSEWAEERNDLIQIIGGSETLFVFSRLDWNEYAMEAHAGNLNFKSFPASTSLSCTFPVQP